MKVVGVTGATGFIGSYVVDELLRRGYEVIAADRSARPLREGVEMFLGDVRDKNAMVELAAHVDGIIHLAAVLGTQETIANPIPAAETNILGGLNLMDACRQYDLPLVYAGVGNYWMRNTYSTTKTTVENLIHQYRDELGCPFAVVRPVNAYGPRQRAAAPFAPGKVRKIVPAFACRALSGIPIEVYGDGSQVSDMIHVSDVASTFVSILGNLACGEVPQNAIEVGPAENVTVMHVAELVCKAAAEITGNPPVEIVSLPMRPGEKSTSDVAPEKINWLLEKAHDHFDESEYAVLRRTLRTLGTRVFSDTSTLTNAGIDHTQFVSLWDGIKSTTEWFLENKGTTWEYNPEA